MLTLTLVIPPSPTFDRCRAVACPSEPRRGDEISREAHGDPYVHSCSLPIAQTNLRFLKNSKKYDRITTWNLQRVELGPGHSKIKNGTSFRWVQDNFDVEGLSRSHRLCDRSHNWVFLIFTRSQTALPLSLVLSAYADHGWGMGSRRNNKRFLRDFPHVSVGLHSTRYRTR